MRACRSLIRHVGAHLVDAAERMRYQIDDFLQVGKPLGSGSYGHVAKVVHKGTSEIFAMKVIPKAKIVEHEMTAYLEREVKTQMGLQHPHILKLHYYFEDKESVQLLLEFAAGGSLFQRLKKEHTLPEPEAARIFTDVSDALVFLHGNDIVHRDLKPENILICDGDVAKLADFGWCADLKNGPERNTFCGTVEYLSPEMVGGEAHDRTVDVWAMGILMYEMLTGGSPFAAKNPTKTFGKIANVDMQIPDYVSNEASDLIRKLLVKEPSQRISLVHAIDHEWARLRVPSASELSRIKGVETAVSVALPKTVETVTAVAGEGLTSPQLRAAAPPPPLPAAAFSGQGSPGAGSAGCAPTLTSVRAAAIDSVGGRAASDADGVAPAGWANPSPTGAGAGAQEGSSPTSPNDALKSHDPTRPLPVATANLIDVLRFDPATRAGDTRPLGPGDGGKEDSLTSPEETVLPAATANFLGYLWASQEDDDTSNLYSEPSSPFGKGKAKTQIYDSAGAKGVRFADPERKVRAQSDFVHTSPTVPLQELDCLSSPASSVSSLGRARLMTVSSISMLPGADQTTPTARHALRHLRDRIHRHREHNEAKRLTELDSLEREQKALQTTRRRLQAEREALRDNSNTSAVLAAAAKTLAAGSGSGSPAAAPGGIGSASRLLREGGSPTALSETMTSFQDVRKWVQERRGSPLTSCSSATGTPGGLSPVSTDEHFTFSGSARGHPGAGGSSRPSWSSPSPRVIASSAAADPCTTLGMMAAPLGSRPEAAEPQERPTLPAVLNTCQEAQGFSSGSAGAPAKPLQSDAGGVHAGGAGARSAQRDDVHFPDDFSMGSSCHRIHSAAALLLAVEADDDFADGGDSPSRLDCGAPKTSAAC